MKSYKTKNEIIPSKKGRVHVLSGTPNDFEQTYTKASSSLISMGRVHQNSEQYTKMCTQFCMEVFRPRKIHRPSYSYVFILKRYPSFDSCYMADSMV